jgi:hypothetical protein
MTNPWVFGMNNKGLYLIENLHVLRKSILLFWCLGHKTYRFCEKKPSLNNQISAREYRFFGVYRHKIYRSCEKPQFK